MKGLEKEVFNVFIRYVILIIVAIPNLWLFYFIFTPLTVYPTYFLLNIFYDAELISKNIILISQTIPIELIDACIAGAAYYLLLILNLTTGKIKTETRIKMILYSFLSLLVLNIIRIFFLSILAISGSSYFYITHVIFWYVLSTIFVVGIWFSQYKIFKIKETPLYSDAKLIYKYTKVKR